MNAPPSLSRCWAYFVPPLSLSSVQQRSFRYPFSPRNAQRRERRGGGHKGPPGEINGSGWRYAYATRRARTFGRREEGLRRTRCLQWPRKRTKESGRAPLGAAPILQAPFLPRRLFLSGRAPPRQWRKPRLPPPPCTTTSLDEEARASVGGRKFAYGRESARTSAFAKWRGHVPVNSIDCLPNVAKSFRPGRRARRPKYRDQRGDASVD